jgi:hypothetical protein
MARVLLSALFLLAACGDEITFILPTFVDGGACVIEDAAVIDSSTMDAPEIDASVPDAFLPVGEVLGAYCAFFDYTCAQPFVCGSNQTCTITCSVIPYNDNAFCTLWDERTICSRVSQGEGRCYIACNTDLDCLTGTRCTRLIDTNRPTGFQRYCSAF